jgi:hypothetical protein
VIRWCICLARFAMPPHDVFIIFSALREYAMTSASSRSVLLVSRSFRPGSVRHGMLFRKPSDSMASGRAPS